MRAAEVELVGDQKAEQVDVEVGALVELIDVEAEVSQASDLERAIEKTPPTSYGVCVASVTTPTRIRLVCPRRDCARANCHRGCCRAWCWGGWARRGRKRWFGRGWAWTPRRSPIDADWACVLTTDPITTASQWRGAARRARGVQRPGGNGRGALGVLATLLFPAGVTAARIAEMTAEIDATARELNVEVLGGHTEIAPGLVAPLVVMTGVGRARRDRLLTAAGARAGQCAGVDQGGRDWRARTFSPAICGRGCAAWWPKRCLAKPGLRGELSVVPEARLAVELGATAMHDPTEGGIVGAAWEMAEASGDRFSHLRRSDSRARGDARDLRCARG